ncbi:MAG TPA: hydantoinase/oxoprolinase family protein [Thermodesulfobacteriota bacterium]|nr:hydantoinase/oxoprolinase family protein [Thermodesulfobacteriota bacterium]
MTPHYFIASDVGGTFTDTILYDKEEKRIFISKVSTTPENQSIGTIRGISKILNRQGLDGRQIEAVNHGMTTGTNTVIQRRGAASALITNRNFRDVLEIGRQNRPSLYNFFATREKPLVEREHRFTIRGRINYRGEVLEDLDEREIKRIALEIKRRKIRAVAICLLHSYINPTHEQRVKEIVSPILGDLSICISCEILPEYREYERFSTTVLNAYLMPVMHRYLTTLEEGLRAKDSASSLKIGSDVPVMIMESSGGVMTAKAARGKPVYTVLSGPAGGVVASTFIGRLTGFHHLITIDMGGTSTDISLILNGRPILTSEGNIEGIPIRVPIIDINAIGAGGGSIAWIDEGGALKVGPQSAEAIPGPACYDQGGDQPTITDANVIFGRIDPNYFLGGEMRLNPERSREVIEERLCGPLKMDLLTAARGIIQVANANMVRGIRVVSVERGYDPRDFTLIPYGGAGPLHAVALAKELKIPKVLVPPIPGILSAMGMLISDIRHDFVLTRIIPVSKASPEVLEAIFEDLKQRALDMLRWEGVEQKDTILLKYVDVRYVGQSFEIRVKFEGEVCAAEHIEELVRNFHIEHEKRYGHKDLNAPVELVNFRVEGIGKREPIFLREIPSGTSEPPQESLKSLRKVYFEEHQTFLDTKIFEREKLLAGNVIEGPAIMEESNSTTLIHPGMAGKVDSYGAILIAIPDTMEL